MQDLFIELFPILATNIPDLTAYQISFDGEEVGSRGGKLAYRLNQTFPGVWVSSEDKIITNEPIAPIQMDIAINQWKAEIPQLYQNLSNIDEIMNWQPSPRNIADYIFWSQIQPIEEDLRLALGKMSVAVERGRIEHEYHLKKWVVNQQPALSLTIQPQLLYELNLQQYTQEVDDRSKIIGLPVTDKTSTMVGVVKGISGTVADRRDTLLELTRREVMQTILKYAPDDELTIEVDAGKYTYEYPASALHILIEPNNHDILQQFNFSPSHAQRALNLTPSTRANLVKTLSDKLKDKDIVDNSFNTRTMSDLFKQAIFEPTIEFANGRTRDVEFETLAYHFEQNGMYERLPRFKDAPIKIAIINTLDESIDDFVEALRRALERNYDFRIDMLRERKVRVISNKNLDSAVKVVQKEDPHVVLAFLPDTTRDNLETLDPNLQQIKSVALGKGIATHAIYRKTMHDPEAMSRVIMAILGKTGNRPYALAEPLEYADMIVGMDMVRQELSQFDRVTAMARIYDNVGRGHGYIMETVELDKGDPVPFIVMQTLFPEERFGGKRVVVHRNGDFTIEELTMLARWEKVIGMTFYPVAISTDVVPHIYRLEKRSIKQPDWGTMFMINDLEALIVTSTTDGDTMPMPLHVKAPFDLGIHYALHSILMWTILNYGTTRPSRLPITIQYAHEMGQWLSRGQLPSATSGDVPFWL